jgi:DNA-binding beta-propeller fold protein YncE
MSRPGAHGRTAGILSRAGCLLIAGASLATFTSFTAPIAMAGGLSSPAPGSVQASFEQSLAGPSEAPMYPSGLIWDPTFPTSGGPTPVVVVADTGYNRISVFDPTACPVPDTSTCAPIESFGSEGSADGEFNTDRDVAVDANSNIYVADAANSRIEAFTYQGTWLWSAGDATDCGSTAACLLNTPIGISYDATTNEVLVADTGHSEVKAYAAVGGAYGFTAGQYIWESPVGVMTSPREARRGPDGEIWVADYHDEEVRAFQCTCTSSSSVGTAWVTTANKVIGDGIDAGHANGEVNSPYNIAFSPDGTIGYVADTGNERIGVYNITSCTSTLNGQANECTFIANYGARCPSSCPLPPGNAGFFNALRRVTVDPATGDIWAADFWGSGIHEFSPSGSTSGMYEIDGSPAPGSGFAEAYGVAVGPDGTTYVADRLNQRIEEFSANGTYVTDEGSRGVAAGEYSWPEAVAVTPDKTVWVGDTRNNRLQHFANADLTGTPTIVGTAGSAVGQFNYIEGVSAAANGLVWIADTDNNRVQSYDPSTQTFAAYGTRGSTPDTNELVNPESVVASATDIYIADTGNNRVVELDLSGNYVASYTDLDAPQGVALAPDGSIWVANTGTGSTDGDGNDIVHLSSSLTLLGGGFGGPGTNNMQFNQPHSLALSPDGTTLFVADTYNNRVQEFSIATQLTFTTQPGGAQPGANLSPQPVVTVEDANGNAVASDTGSVTIALTGPTSANLTCASGLTVAEVNGVASFSGCSVDTPGSYTLTASDGSLPWSTSQSFTIGTVGPPAQLAFTPSPGGAAQNAALSPQPVVSVEDSSGNVVTADNSHVTISLNGPGTLTCTNTGGLTARAVNGVATFSGCSVDTVGSGDTLTASDTADSLPNATSGSFNVTAATAQAPYSAVTPYRVCDTRPVAPGIASNQCNTGSPSGPITNNATRTVKVTGGGVPSTATAVVLNLTAIAPTARTLLAVFPTGGARSVSNVNPLPGQVVAVLVEVGIGTHGDINVYNGVGSINVAIDIEGYVASTSTGLFTPTAPTRICDTRASGGGIASNQCNNSSPGQHPLGPNGVLSFVVSGSGSPVPSTGVTAVVFNLTAIDPSVRTDLAAYPGNLANHPVVSNVNLEAGQAVANRVIVPVPSGCSGSTCTVKLWNSAGDVNVAVDIDGWFGTASGSQFTALASPVRICDTRVGGTAPGCANPGMVAAGAPLHITVTGIDGIPALGGANSPLALVANITAVDATTGTYITVFPGNLAVPNASDVNVPNFNPVTNLVVVGIDPATGTINLANAAGNVDLIVDVFGYYS